MSTSCPSFTKWDVTSLSQSWEAEFFTSERKLDTVACRRRTLTFSQPPARVAASANDVSAKETWRRQRQHFTSRTMEKLLGFFTSHKRIDTLNTSAFLPSKLSIIFNEELLVFTQGLGCCCRNHERKLQKVLIVALSLCPTGYKGTALFFIYSIYSFFNLLSLCLCLKSWLSLICNVMFSFNSDETARRRCGLIFLGFNNKKKSCCALSVCAF